MTAMAAPRAPATPALTPATGSIRLAAQHFVAATFYLVAGSAGLLWIAPELAAGAYLSPRVGGVTHLFTLGWLTTMIFGALTQLLPVALGAPLRYPRVAEASFWTFAPGGRRPRHRHRDQHAGPPGPRRAAGRRREAARGGKPSPLPLPGPETAT